MKVGRKRRVLLVVANLTTHGRKDLKWLYRWLDANAVAVPKLVLLSRYRSIHQLVGEKATTGRFVDTLTRLARDPRTDALDVLVSLHGTKKKLWFADGAIKTSELADRISAKHLEDKLRLLYSTACYGANHASDFVRAGFRIASGAVGVNANGAHDYPTQLLYWGLGARYKDVLAAGNNKLFARIYDKLARKARFEDVCSIKIAVGRGKTSITSQAG